MDEFKRKLLNIQDDDVTEIVTKSGMSMKLYMESVDMLQEWFEKQPHFPENSFDRDYMMRFLALNKFSLEKTKSKLDTLLTARTLIPEMLGNRDTNDKKLINALTNMEYVVMPDKTEKNERIHVARITSPDSDKYDPIMAFKVVFMLADMRLKTDNNLEGDIIVWDCENYKMGHIVKMTPMLTKKAIFILEGCYSARIKAMHFINCPSYALSVLNLIKSIVKVKLAKRIFIHAKVEDLFQHMNQEIMPKDLGGGFPLTRSEIADCWLNNIKSNEWRQWFEEIDKCRSDESKRPKNQQNSYFDDHLGVEGSFRKLDID